VTSTQEVKRGHRTDSEVTALAFTGKDTSAGKSFAAWVKKYNEKKAAGEKNIWTGSESLDEE